MPETPEVISTSSSSEKENSTAVLLGSIISDAKKLAELEIQLLKLEAKAHLAKVERRFLALCTALALLFPALFLLGQGLVGFLENTFDLPAWVSSICVGMLFGLPFIFLSVKASKREDNGTNQ